MNWFDSYVAFDTETTGLGGTARIVEVAVVTFEKGVPVREWSSLLYPPDVDWAHPDVRKALEINHIAFDDLRGKPTFEQVLPDLLVELSHDVWVAHNAEFDLRMLAQEHKRLGRELRLPKLSVCTKNLSAHFGGGKGNRLFHTAERYGIAQEDAHRAAVDARVCGQILAKWVETGRLPASDAEMATLCQKTDAAWRGKHRW